MMDAHHACAKIQLIAQTTVDSICILNYDLVPKKELLQRAECVPVRIDFIYEV
eukprot:jgi/Botrbrau1/12536/Bobra.0169s0078.1